MESRVARAKVQRAITDAAAAGDPPLRRRRGGVPMWPLSDGFSGWLGLNTATRQHEGVDVNSVIGVRHAECEALVARLSDRRDDGVTGPTISTQLGYVTPAERHLAWTFMEPADLAPVAEELMQAVRAHGVPWAQRYTDLERLYSEGLPRYSIKEYRTRREPVLALLLGREEEAEERLAAYLEQLGSREDDAAQAYRAFAERFRSLVRDRR